MEHWRALTAAAYLIFFAWGAQCASVRLVPEDDSRPHEGRLEVFLDGEWGTVCDDFFTPFEGRVVCQQLNYSGVLRVFTAGGGSGSILLDDVHCSCGNETSLLDCYHLRESNCNHGEDVGIECNTNFPDREGAVQLAGGNRTAGRVEVFINNEWGTISDLDWGPTYAAMVCNQLGFTGVPEIPSRGSYPPGVGRIWRLCENCTLEMEEGLIIDYLITEGCETGTAHEHDAAVICSPDHLETPTEVIVLTTTEHNQNNTEVSTMLEVNTTDTDNTPSVLVSTTGVPSTTGLTPLAIAITAFILAIVCIAIILSGVSILVLRLANRYKITRKDERLSSTELFTPETNNFTIIQNTEKTVDFKGI